MIGHMLYTMLTTLYIYTIYMTTLHLNYLFYFNYSELNHKYIILNNHIIIIKYITTYIGYRLSYFSNLSLLFLLIILIY